MFPLSPRVLHSWFPCIYKVLILFLVETKKWQRRTESSHVNNKYGKNRIGGGL